MIVAMCALMGITVLLATAPVHSGAQINRRRALPDLIVQTLQPGDSYEGDMQIYVYNQGAGAAGASTLGIIQRWGRRTYTYDIPVPALGPHQGYWMDVVPYNGNLFAPGTLVRYIADVFNVVEESNETNNEKDYQN
jgi:hypothetical protein